MKSSLAWCLEPEWCDREPAPVGTIRTPIFSTLDAMILAGWGDTPQNEIPANWLECAPSAERISNPIVDEIRAQELDMVWGDQYGSREKAIAAIERKNAASSGMLECADRIFAEARERYKQAAKQRVGQHRRWNERIAGREADLVHDFGSHFMPRPK